MGKKLQGAALRAKKRAREAIDLLQEEQAERTANAVVEEQPDASLFVIDTVGNSGGPLVSQLKNKQKRQKHSEKRPEKEAMAIERLRQKYDKESLLKQAEHGRRLQHRRFMIRSTVRGNTKANFDLWQNDANEGNETTTTRKKEQEEIGVGSALAGTFPTHVVTKARKTTRKKEQVVSVDVATAGQSYRPDPIAHKNTLSNAVEVEVAREKALKERDTPLAQGLSRETRALLVGSDEEDCSGDEGDSINTPVLTPVGSIPKRADKKTRAQRNKEQRRRQEEAIRKQQAQQKKLLNEVSEIPRYRNEMKREERQKKQLAMVNKQDDVPVGAKLQEKLVRQDPIRAPTLPVALQASSSLRRVQPKGSLATDRIVSLMDRDLAPKPTGNLSHARGKRRRLAVKEQQK